jgi:hypothetical protein
MSIPIRIVGQGIDLPATIQAIGSVVAIIWGVLVYWRGLEDRKVEARERKHVVGRAATEAVSFASDQLAGLASITTDARTKNAAISEVSFDRLTMADEILKSVPVLEADRGGTTHALLATRSRIAQARRRSIEFNAALKLTPNVRAKTLADIQRQIERLRFLVENDLTELRATYPSARSLTL